MHLIVGLGNPGPEYSLTPHNAGFLAIDRLAEQCGVTAGNRRGRALTARATVAGKDVLLAKPETFMNASGLSVAALLQELEITPAELIVLYDELAFPLGTVRVREQGSANGHNGVKSISSILKTEIWPRVRIGVGKPPTEDGRPVKAGGTDYLLGPMRRHQLAELGKGLDLAVGAVELILTRGILPAMSQYNQRGTNLSGDLQP